MYRLLLITFLLFPSGRLFAEEEPVITWLLSWKERSYGHVDLVRMVDGKIDQKIPVGKSLAYACSDSRIVISGYEMNKRVLKTFDLNTGKELTRCSPEDIRLPGSATKLGEPTPLNCIVIDEQDLLLYSIDQYRDYHTFPEARFSSYEKYGSTLFRVIDLKTGECLAEESTGWNKIGEITGGSPKKIGKHIGFQLTDGRFLEYLPEKKTLEGRIVPEMKKKEKVSVHYYQGIGLVEYDDQDQSRPTLTILTNPKLRPVREKKTYPYPDYPGLRSSGLKISKDQIVVTLITNRDSLNRKEENPVTTVVLYDLIQKKEIFKKEFPLKVRFVRLSENLDNFYLRDPRNKLAYHYNRTSGKLLKIDYSWSPYAEFIYCFPQPDP